MLDAVENKPSIKISSESRKLFTKVNPELPDIHSIIAMGAVRNYYIYMLMSYANAITITSTQTNMSAAKTYIQPYLDTHPTHQSRHNHMR